MMKLSCSGVIVLKIGIVRELVDRGSRCWMVGWELEESSSRPPGECRGSFVAQNKVSYLNIGALNLVKHPWEQKSSYTNGI